MQKRAHLIADSMAAQLMRISIIDKILTLNQRVRQLLFSRCRAEGGRDFRKIVRCLAGMAAHNDQGGDSRLVPLGGREGMLGYIREHMGVHAKSVLVCLIQKKRFWQCTGIICPYC